MNSAPCAAAEPARPPPRPRSTNANPTAIAAPSSGPATYTQYALKSAPTRSGPKVRAGFSDVGQGAFGFWFKFVAENVPFAILPFFVLYAIYLQVDYLTRRAGARAAGGTVAPTADEA